MQHSSLFPIEAFYQVFPHIPALAVQQHANLSVSVSHSRLHNLPDAHPKSGPRVFVTAIAECPAIQLDFAACPPLAHRVAAMQVLDDLIAPPGLYNVLDSTSCNIAWSNVRSATNCFSRVFSSWSCLSCRTGSTSSPTSCFLHR